jgi:integrase
VDKIGKRYKRPERTLSATTINKTITGLTLHALRRTFASVLVALGHDPRYVMDQIGHSNPTVTLGIYAQVMGVSDKDRGRLRALVEGGEQDGDIHEHIGAPLAA